MSKVIFGATERVQHDRQMDGAGGQIPPAEELGMVDSAVKAAVGEKVGADEGNATAAS